MAAYIMLARILWELWEWLMHQNALQPTVLVSWYLFCISYMDYSRFSEYERSCGLELLFSFFCVQYKLSLTELLFHTSSALSDVRGFLDRGYKSFKNNDGDLSSLVCFQIKMLKYINILNRKQVFFFKFSSKGIYLIVSEILRHSFP